MSCKREVNYYQIIDKGEYLGSANGITNLNNKNNKQSCIYQIFDLYSLTKKRTQISRAVTFYNCSNPPILHSRAVSQECEAALFLYKTQLINIKQQLKFKQQCLSPVQKGHQGTELRFTN